MKTNPNLAPERYSELVATITNALGPCTIYAFGYRHKTIACSILNETTARSQCTHFDLLVFSRTSKPNAAADLANLIRERLGVAVSLLLHKPTDLVTKQSCQQWFLWNILHRAQRLSLDKTAIPFLPDDRIPVRDANAVRGYWLKCEAVAAFYINAAADSAHLGVGLIKIALLHEAAAQIGLGLIRIFLGYTPNHFGLSHLLDLCGHFTDLPAETFIQKTPEQQKRYKMLCAPPTMLRHWQRLDADENDFTVLLHTCTEFLENAKLLAAAELEKLETTLKTTAI